MELLIDTCVVLYLMRTSRRQRKIILHLSSNARHVRDNRVITLLRDTVGTDKIEIYEIVTRLVLSATIHN